MEQAATKRVILAVSGMSCGGCAASVERALRQAHGVREAEVDFASGQAAIQYDPAQTRPDALAALVADSGFEAGPGF